VKAINIDSLSPGQVTATEYFSSSGDLLIGKNVFLTERHLDILKRRNIFELYIRDKDTELKKLLDTEFDEVQRLPYGEEENLSGRLFPEIKSGEEGYRQLLQNESASLLDNAFDLGQVSDIPSGPEMKASMKQHYLADRTEDYKKEVKLTYSEALKQVKIILNKLANGEKVDTGRVRAIIDLFIDTFLNDRNIILALSSCKPEKNDHIYYHTLNVCLIAMNIAAASGFNENQVIDIGVGALLHDVGMLLVPPKIRFKKGRLTNDEWYEVRKHPLTGLSMIERFMTVSDSVKFIAYQTHERENGKGYTKQRRGRFIHNYAKITQVADIFEALCSPRPYRKALVPYKGVEMLIKMSKQGLVSAEYVRSFLSYSSIFPIGSIVELCDGRVARVISANSKLDRPVVSVLQESNGSRLEKNKIYQVDLSIDRELQVVRSLPFDSVNLDIMDGF